MTSRGSEAAAAARRAAHLTLAGPPRLGQVRLVAVDGPSGSGKTRFAARLLREFEHRGLVTELFGTDALATWDDPFGWWPRLEAGLLGPLQRGEPGRIAVHDWASGIPRPAGIRTVETPSVVIIEGVSVGRRALQDRATVLVWVECADLAKRLERAVARDGEQIRPHLLRWQQEEAAFFAEDAVASRADLRITSD